MALTYYDDEQTQWSIKRLSNDHSNWDKPFFSGTALQEVQDAVKGLGYTWDRWQWPDDSLGFSNGLEAIKSSLDDRKPVILVFNNLNTPRPETTHALLAFGYDADLSELFILDPAWRSPGRRYIPFDKLKELWSDKGLRYALFTARKGDVPDGHPKNGKD